ncbi:hypothetical protein [Nocardia nepalensis]|uniref:hypothetical protein n=1 Tax=Nocardia nepalensis TaxID=3375448 RepID=UPI003B682A94
MTAKHFGNPSSSSWAKRLNALRDNDAYQQQASQGFLTELSELARDTTAAQKPAAAVP